MTAKPFAAAVPADAAGTERVRDIAMQTAERFMQRLVARAAAAALTPDDVREAFAAFRADSLSLEPLFAEFTRKPARPASGNKRSHPFERAMIERFQARFDYVTADGQKLSRRVIIGYTYALTKALTSDGFRQFDMEARRVAAGLTDQSRLNAHPQISRIVDSALVALARSFDGEFLVALKTFTDLINSRLAAPKPKHWDTEWELSRPLAVTMLDDLFANLRTELETETLHPAYGRDAAEVLDRFFAGLDRARKLADRPWLRKSLG